MSATAAAIHTAPGAVLPATLIGQSPAQLRTLLTDLGEPAFRADQLHHWLYVKCVRDYAQMTNLARSCQAKLASHYPQVGPLTIRHRQQSSDGTLKYLFATPDDQAIEAVLMHFTDRDTYALCISTQVGCAVNCSFCATAKLGFRRQLTAAEMVDQYVYAQADSGQTIRNIVFMGQGEPLLNMDEWLKAVYRLNQSAEVGMRHMTVSTSGIVPGIERLMKERLQLTLAVSLHAADDETRSQIMPINRKYPLSMLMPVLHRYVAHTGRRLTIEYLLLAGVNDHERQAQQLAQLLKGLKCNINLIPYNAVDSQYQRPSRQQTLRFQAILNGYGKKTTVRIERGTDIDAACGQLANRMTKPAT